MQQQLSMRAAAQGVQPVPKYFTDKKEFFLQQVAGLGLDLYQVKDWLDSHGICEMNIQTL